MKYRIIDLSKRGIAIAAAALLIAAAPTTTTLTTTTPTTTTIDGFTIDWQGGPQTPEMVGSLTTQIKAVEDAPVSPAAAAFFRSQKITVDLPGKGPGDDPATRWAQDTGPARASLDGIFFARMATPPANPVLLHELMHRWEYAKMPQGAQNPDVLRFYRQARASGKWPAGSYMLKNPQEFWAMTASTVLHGRTARPPFTREAVKVNVPDLYAFIVREFGYHGP